MCLFLRCQSVEPPVCEEEELPQYNMLCSVLKDPHGTFGECVQDILNDPEVKPSGVSLHLLELNALLINLIK